MWDKMETPRIVYDLDTSGGLMEVRQDGIQVIFYFDTVSKLSLFRGELVKLDQILAK